MIKGVLPASQTSNSLLRHRRPQRWLVGLVVALIVYTFLAGLGLLLGYVRPEYGYLLLVLPCLAPVGWYAYGFIIVTEAEQDFGLLLSALGWAFIAIALLIQHRAAMRYAGGNPAPGVLKPTEAIVCSIFAFICILAGAVLAWHSWSRENPGS